MKQKKFYDNEYAVSYIGDNNLDGAHWPEIIGPISMMDTKGTLEMALEEEIMNILLGEDPDAVGEEFMARLMTEIYLNLGEDATIEELIFFGLDEIPTEIYDQLYDHAYDALCVNEGGVIINPGGPFKKQCSYADADACHAASPWVPTVGMAEADSLYTEWRNKKYFENTPINIHYPKEGTKTFHYENIPAEGACTMQSPALHSACNTKIVVKEYEGIGKAPRGTIYYSYDRSTGNCVATEEVCRVLGLGSGGNKVHDPINDVELHDCGNSHAGAILPWITEQVFGMSLAQQAESCLFLGKQCCKNSKSDCLHEYNVEDSSKNNDMITKPS
jgi:hypothetical protein